MSDPAGAKSMCAQRIEIDEAMRISEVAFLPGHATTSADSNDASFSLRVFDDAGEERLSIPHIARTQTAIPPTSPACSKAHGCSSARTEWR